MKQIKVEEAVGLVLAHDVTKIIPGKFKGPAFKKGHIIQAEDIQELKRMGKNHINVVNLSENEIHEDEAAIRIAQAVMGDHLTMKGPTEGKISIVAAEGGLLRVEVELLKLINGLSPVILATLHDQTLIRSGQTVAGTRIIPLSTEKSKIQKLEALCHLLGPVLTIKPLLTQTVGIVVTGSEVYEGTITDRFGPVIEQKARFYGADVLKLKYAPDDPQIIVDKMKELLEEGATILIALGGMSVDADDVTPNAISQLADEGVMYGAPVLPGAMFMAGYHHNFPILGIPACGMYHKTTVFDALFPRIMVGERITREDIIDLGHGGLCLNCEVCHYPVCPFCK